MVDVGAKPDTERVAVAGGEVHLQPSTIDLIRQGLVKKGDVLAIAKIAGIMGSKRTSDLIPLCHPISLTQVDVTIQFREPFPILDITASARTIGKTGVEMEALTAVSIAALTVYDMVKAVDRSATIQNIRLIEKRGGMSGEIRNE